MTWLAAIVASLGALLYLTAALGLFRLPGALARLEAVTKASTLGLGLCLLGCVIAVPTASFAIKCALVIAFLWLVTPVSGHLVGRAAYKSGARGTLVVDELREQTAHTGPAPESKRSTTATTSQQDTDAQD